MSTYEQTLQELTRNRRTWLVTGAAGFIGSHLAEVLLRHGQSVVAVDNFATGSQENLDEAAEASTEDASFRFVEGDLVDPEVCRAVIGGVDIVLHQAALGSVPRSFADPLATHHANLTAFANLLLAARDGGVERLVYASSSSVYGDAPGLPKKEEVIGRPLSPYAVTKRANELYADAMYQALGFPMIGLRYFNVFGPRQNPDGPYAAVIPRWIGSLVSGDPCTIFGDGETSRDFSYIANPVQANLLAATTPLSEPVHRVYNVACGGRTTLNELYRLIRTEVARYLPEAAAQEPEYADFRPGDVRHSEADIHSIVDDLGYFPTHELDEGIRDTVRWYVEAYEPDQLTRASATRAQSGMTR
jgi:UDP-N-acetylglucosamine/UDP-N-acetylgalactosamine 4-epimerase